MKRHYIALCSMAREKCKEGAMSKRNDKERALWVDNDESMYLWKRRTGLSMQEFLRENRKEIDYWIDLQLGIARDRQ